MMELSTVELLQNLKEYEIKVTEEEALRLRGNVRKLNILCVICAISPFFVENDLTNNYG